MSFILIIIFVHYIVLLGSSFISVRGATQD